MASFLESEVEENPPKNFAIKGVYMNYYVDKLRKSGIYISL